MLKPYLALLYAELESVAGKKGQGTSFREARSLYLDAIDAAHEQKFTFLEGYINECLGELYRKTGLSSEGVYFTEAQRLYKKCQAERKETNLIKRYPEYFDVSTTTATLPELDVADLLKSAFAISAEIEHDALLKKIMNVVIESSGAQHGYLLIEDDGNILVRAESHIGDKPAVQSLNQKLEGTEGISKVIVHYVQRTGEKVILNDACQEGIFKDNPEVQRMQLRSVLCLPVVKKSGMFGNLYLENRLAASVFTPEKIQTMELLASQAAISLENARLVDDMKKAEEQVETSLKQKETLLKEIHHRVKNNLQIIHSMLNLQLPQVKDTEAIELFKESQNRVFTMALIHEKLYQSESMARIDLPEYVRGLVANLFFTYGVTGGTIRPKISVEDVSLDIDLTIPCALIINELVSNSLKHAFPPSKWSGQTGEIRIELHCVADDTLTLTVSDNGIGLPPSFEIEDSPSLGLKLVRVLAKQLKGTIHISADNGTEISITFPIPHKEAG